MTPLQANARHVDALCGLSSGWEERCPKLGLSRSAFLCEPLIDFFLQRGIFLFSRRRRAKNESLPLSGSTPRVARAEPILATGALLSHSRSTSSPDLSASGYCVSRRHETPSELCRETASIGAVLCTRTTASLARREKVFPSSNVVALPSPHGVEPERMSEVESCQNGPMFFPRRLVPFSWRYRASLHGERS